MAMVNGQWQEEDASVEKRVNGMVQSGSPLMKTAAASADREANRRGLANSSIAVGKAQEAVIKTATPIASQDAGQIHERNLSSQNYGQTKDITGMQIQGQKDITGMQIRSAEGIASADRTSREGIAAGDRTNRLDIQRMSDQGAMDRTRISEEGATTRQTNSDNAAMARTNVTEAGATARNNATIRSNDTQAAVQGVTAANNTYSAGYQAIMNNPDIPPDVRNAHIEHLGITRDNSIALYQSVFNVQLPWAQTPGGSQTTPPPGQTPQPTLPTTPNNPNPTNQMPAGWDPETGRWVGNGE